MLRTRPPQAVIIRVVIGALLGLLLGIFIGSPIFGIIMGALLGFRIPDFGRKSHIDIRKGLDQKYIYGAIPVFIALLMLVWYFRPWFHDALIIFYMVPVIPIMIIFAIGLGLAIFFRVKSLIGILAIIMGFLFIILVFNDVLVQKSIVNTETYTSIETLPDSDSLRLLPQAVAYRYLEDSLQKSREKVGPLDIIMLNGSLVWTSPRIPDGGILYLTQPVNGILVADATMTDRETRIISHEMAVGEGIGITDNIRWRIYKDQFFITIDDIYYVVEGQTVYAVASIISYDFRFPIMVPEFKGVYIIDSEGTLQWVEKKDIGDIPILEGNKIFPESLARLYVDSYKYNLGWINAVFLHKDQIEISDVYGQGNRQPFLMDTDDGLKWVVATEPYGNSYGVFKIFLVDAFDGKIQMLELDEDQTLTGPVRVVSYVKKKFPTIDWATAGVIEPRPYIIDGKLLWMLSITPSDFAGVSYTVLVNSENNEVLAFESDTEISDYIDEGRITELLEEPVGEPEEKPKLPKITLPEVEEPNDQKKIEPDERESESSDPQTAYIDEKTKQILRDKIEEIEDELDDLKRLLED